MAQREGELMRPPVGFPLRDAMRGRVGGSGGMSNERTRSAASSSPSRSDASAYRLISDVKVAPGGVGGCAIFAAQISACLLRRTTMMFS